MSLSPDRRKFLFTSLKAAALLPFASPVLQACTPESDSSGENSTSESKKLSILILGGTSFIGPHQIAYALGRGHSVSTFTRGKTVPSIHTALFDQVESLIGDRKDNLEALKNRKWDVVIDNSGHNVEWTRATAELLKDNVGLYVFTSSTGVFYPYLGNEFTEDKQVLLEEPEGIEDEEMKMEYWYGVMKSNSELVARQHFGDDRTIVVRPTYMIGPADKTDRFIHWPVRLAKGGEVLVPGKSEDPVQYIDVRDVAEWMIRLIEEGNAGTYNAVGPKEATGMGEFVAEASEAFDVQHTLVTVDDYDFLMENNVPYLVPWVMPIGNNAGSSLISNKKAVANGLTFRPLPTSISDIHDWWYSDALTEERRQEFEGKADGVLAREASILEAWKVAAS